MPYLCPVVTTRWLQSRGSRGRPERWLRRIAVDPVVWIPGSGERPGSPVGDSLTFSSIARRLVNPDEYASPALRRGRRSRALLRARGLPGQSRPTRAAHLLPSCTGMVKRSSSAARRHLIPEPCAEVVGQQPLLHPDPAGRRARSRLTSRPAIAIWCFAILRGTSSASVPDGIGPDRAPGRARSGHGDGFMPASSPRRASCWLSSRRCRRARSPGGAAGGRLDTPPR